MCTAITRMHTHSWAHNCTHVPTHVPTNTIRPVFTIIHTHALALACHKQHSSLHGVQSDLILVVLLATVQISPVQLATMQAGLPQAVLAPLLCMPSPACHCAGWLATVQAGLPLCRLACHCPVQLATVQAGCHKQCLLIAIVTAQSGLIVHITASLTQALAAADLFNCAKCLLL
jgi:hypothetical protein